MASMRYHVRIEASADAVWGVVGRPELLHLWFPGITSCTVEGDRRTIVTGNGVAMPEEIVTHDDLLRRFQYRITTPVFRHHLATIDVLDLDDGTCVVQYATDADPAVMALVIGGGTLGALRELQRQFHAGSGPALDAAANATGKETVRG
jgi:hypothetical protein